MVKPSESKPPWSYLALFLGGIFRKVIQIDLRLYDSLTKFRPMEKHVFIIFYNNRACIIEKCEKYFCYLYRIVEWYHIVACFSVRDNFPKFKNSETQIIYILRRYLDA